VGSPTVTCVEAFRRALGAYRLTHVILAAFNLHLFTVMGRRVGSISKLAVVLWVSRRGLKILCPSLPIGGLLEKYGQVYRATVFVATVFNAQHFLCRGCSTP